MKRNRLPQFRGVACGRQQGDVMKYGYLDKFERHERTVGEFHTQLHDRERQLYKTHRQPENVYQALMETLPGEDVPMTDEEREQDWELFSQRVQNAGLTERETLVVNCIVYGGRSLTQTATIVAQAEGLSRAPDKMSMSRCRDRAFIKLRKAFEGDI
jgi:hypothetical protein